MAVAQKADQVPLNDPTSVDHGLLQLDSQNPRLIISESDARSDETIIRELYLEGELTELIKSISANGYLDFEPLVVCLSSDKKKLTVLEGNRRLAAIRVLSDPKLAKKLNIPVPELRANVTESFKEIRVIRVKDREAARPFIAFKHINGPHRWDSYAKAKFASAWYLSEKKTNTKDALLSIAQRIGDNHDTIKRMVAAVFVLDQASEANLFHIEDRATKKFSFSHLYTALSRSEYMTYLGLSDAWTKFEPKSNPIKKTHYAQLKEVLNWIYGSKENNELPVIQSQNPDLKNLGIVLASSSGIHVLREQRDLSKAVSEAIPPSEKLTSALIQSRSNLQMAVSNLRAYDGKDRSLFDIASDVKELAETLYSRMKEKAGLTSKGVK